MSLSAGGGPGPVGKLNHIPRRTTGDYGSIFSPYRVICAGFVGRGEEYCFPGILGAGHRD